VRGLHLPACLLRAALFVGTAALAVLPMCVAYPRIGHDFAYFLPRLADTFLYLQRNGPSIQWWTPAFGGGLPVFANPQDLQLSLPQLLSFGADPFVAVCASFALVTLAGCYALHRLARGPLGWEEAPACLLAVAASTGGFTTLHMAVGHAGYHAIALTPVLLLLAVDRQIPPRLAIPVAAVIGAYFVHSGGYFVSFVAGLALGIAVPVVLLLAPRPQRLLAAGGVLAGGAALALALSAAKLFAVFSWMRVFPRFEPTPALPSLLSPLLQLWSTPVVTLLGVGGLPSELHRALFAQPVGPWETDASLALPVVLAAFVALPVVVVRLLRGGTRREHALALFAVAAALLVLVLAAGRGPVFVLLKQLPGLAALRVNARFTAALTLPVCLVGVFALSHAAARWRGASHRRGLVWMLIAAALLQQAGYVGLVGRHAGDVGVWYDAGAFLDFCARLRANPDAVGPIAYVDRVSDPVALATSRSSLLLYEPLLGAFVQNYPQRTPLEVGPATRIRDGRFNMHLPPAFSYPASVGQPPFSRIPATQRAELERFLARRAPGWGLPAAQRAANATSLAALVLIVIWMVALAHPRLRRPPAAPARNARRRAVAPEPDRRSGSRSPRGSRSRGH
jgi:hypothetical protein